MGIQGINGIRISAALVTGLLALAWGSSPALAKGKPPKPGGGGDPCSLGGRQSTAFEWVNELRGGNRTGFETGVDTGFDKLGQALATTQFGGGLLVAASAKDQVAVFHLDASGALLATFALAMPLDGDYDVPDALAFGNFNGDGVPDIFAADTTNYFASVFLGDNCGSEAVPTICYSGGADLEIAQDPEKEGFGLRGRIAAGDLDGDERDEVIVGATWSNSRAGAVFVYDFTGNPVSVTETKLTHPGGATIEFGTGVSIGRVDSVNPKIVVGARTAGQGFSKKKHSGRFFLCAFPGGECSQYAADSPELTELRNVVTLNVNGDNGDVYDDVIGAAWGAPTLVYTSPGTWITLPADPKMTNGYSTGISAGYPAEGEPLLLIGAPNTMPERSCANSGVVYVHWNFTDSDEDGVADNYELLQTDSESSVRYGYAVAVTTGSDLVLVREGPQPGIIKVYKFKRPE